MIRSSELHAGLIKIPRLSTWYPRRLTFVGGIIVVVVVAGIESWEDYGRASAQSETGCWAVERLQILVKADEDFGELPNIVFEVEVASDYGHTTTQLHHRVFQISELIQPPVRKYPYK